MSVMSFILSSRSSSSRYKINDKLASLMDSIFAIGAGLGLRFVVDAVTRNDFKITGTLVGLWEGVIMLHFLKKMPRSTDPFIAYAVRLFIDFLVTESIGRLVLVLIWTCLGMVLADISPVLWADTGLRRIWRRIRRDLYTLSEMIPTVVFSPPRRTVRFSPSRTSTLVSQTVPDDDELTEAPSMYTPSVATEGLPPSSIIPPTTLPTTAATTVTATTTEVSRRRLPGYLAGIFTDTESMVSSILTRGQTATTTSYDPSRTSRRLSVYPTLDGDTASEISTDSPGQNEEQLDDDHDDYTATPSSQSTDVPERSPGGFDVSRITEIPDEEEAPPVSALPVVTRVTQATVVKEQRTPTPKHPIPLPPTPSDSQATWRRDLPREEDLAVPPSMPLIPDEESVWENPVAQHAPAPPEKDWPHSSSHSTPRHQVLPTPDQSRIIPNAHDVFTSNAPPGTGRQSGPPPHTSFAHIDTSNIDDIYGEAADEKRPLAFPQPQTRQRDSFAAFAEQLERDQAAKAEKERQESEHLRLEQEAARLQQEKAEEAARLREEEEGRLEQEKRLAQDAEERRLREQLEEEQRHAAALAAAEAEAQLALLEAERKRRAAESEALRLRLQEEERLRKAAEAEVARLTHEAEERRLREEEERQRREAEAEERRRREEEEWQRRQVEAEQLRQLVEEERQRREAEAEERRRQEEKEQQRREAEAEERRVKEEEEERQRREAEEAQLKEEAEALKRQQAEEDRVRVEAEAAEALKRKQEEAAEEQQRELEELQKQEEEGLRLEAEQEAARLQAEAEEKQRREADEEFRRRLEEDERARQEEEEIRRRAQEEEDDRLRQQAETLEREMKAEAEAKAARGAEKKRRKAEKEEAEAAKLRQDAEEQKRVAQEADAAQKLEERLRLEDEERQRQEAEQKEAEELRVVKEQEKELERLRLEEEEAASQREAIRAQAEEDDKRRLEEERKRQEEEDRRKAEKEAKHSEAQHQVVQVEEASMSAQDQHADPDVKAVNEAELMSSEGQASLLHTAAEATLNANAVSEDKDKAEPSSDPLIVDLQAEEVNAGPTPTTPTPGSTDLPTSDQPPPLPPKDKPVGSSVLVKDEDLFNLDHNIGAGNDEELEGEVNNIEQDRMETETVLTTLSTVPDKLDERVERILLTKAQMFDIETQIQDLQRKLQDSPESDKTPLEANLQVTEKILRKMKHKEQRRWDHPVPCEVEPASNDSEHEIFLEGLSPGNCKKRVQEKLEELLIPEAKSLSLSIKCGKGGPGKKQKPLVATTLDSFGLFPYATEIVQDRRTTIEVPASAFGEWLTSYRVSVTSRKEQPA